MDTILQVNGQEVTLTEEQLTAIVAKHLEEQNGQEAEQNEGDMGFMINPTKINQAIFAERRNDKRQEWARNVILDAFCVMKRMPQYRRSFNAIVPEKDWTIKSVRELKELSRDLGDHMADWVELALTWAHRIAGGEPWEMVCNKSDTEQFYRLVIWKDGKPRLIGGSWVDDNYRPSTSVSVYYCEENDTFHSTVPLVISYEAKLI